MWKTILRLLPEAFSLLRLIPAVRKYFEVERRRVRASLISQLAADALSLVALQKGVSLDEAAQLQELIDQLRDKLIGEGLAKNNAEEIAKASIAGALAKLKAREELLGQ